MNVTHFHVQQIQHTGVMEGENAFKNQDMAGVDGGSLWLSLMLLE